MKKNKKELLSAHLVKLVDTIDSKSVPIYLGYRFESDSE